MKGSVLLVDLNLVFFDDGFQWFVRDVKEFHEAFSTPENLFVLGIEDDGIAPSNIVPVEGLMGVDLVFFRTPCGQAEVDDGELFLERIWIFDALDSLAVFDDVLIDILRISVDFFELSDCPKLFTLFCPRNRVPLFLELDLLVRV